MTLPEAVKQQIDSIALKYALILRHADRIETDPEGQRIKQTLETACLESYRLGVPEETGITIHVTGGENGKSNASESDNLFSGNSDGKHRPLDQDVQVDVPASVSDGGDGISDRPKRKRNYPDN